MEILILIVSLLFVLVGIAGSVLPAVPGPPLSWIGLLILYTMPSIEFDYWTLGITFVFTLIIVILDYVIPAQGTKRFGGSKYGIWGTNIGLIVGIIALSKSGEAAASYNLVFAGTTLALIPVLVAYSIGNKYFVSGLSAGAVKG